MKTIFLAALLSCGVPHGLSASSFDEGARLMRENRYAQALPLLEQAAHAQPGSAEVLLNLGWAYWHTKRIADAWKIGTTLVKLDGDNPTFLVFLANTEIERRDYQAALRLAGRALKLAPDDKDASLVSSRALFLLRREEDALAVLDDVLKRQPDHAQALHRKAVFLSEMGRKEAALGILERLVKYDPGNTAYRRERARIFYDLGRWEEAKTEWRELVRREPDASSLLNLGWALWRDKDIDEAWKIGGMLLKLDAGNPAALRFMANMEMERFNYPEAMRLARKALVLAPGDRDASLVLVKALFALTREREAAALLRRLARENEGHLPAQYLWADYLARRGKPAEALGVFSRLIAADAANDLYRLGRAQVLCDLGRFPEAVKEWSALALRQEPNLEALRRLREDALARRAWDEALEWQARIIAARPADAEDWELVSKIQTSRRNPPGALEAARKAIALDPHSINGYYRQAEAFEQMQDWPAAQKAYEDLARRNPNSLRALNGLSNALEAQGDYLGAIKAQHSQARLALPSVSPQLTVREARLLADAGRLKSARRLLEKTTRQRQTPIPALLYHGVLRDDRSDPVNISQEAFRGHMTALKKAGYQTITVTELERYLRDPEGLPDKPLLLTFDDGRVDSFENAFPVLEEMDFKATMFVHLSRLRRLGFHSGAEELRVWQGTGRWDIQAHGIEAHDPAPMDQDGRKGRYLANRLWLDRKDRLETLAEYRARLDNEFKTAKQGVEDLLPGSRVVAFAFPYGDFGQADKTNTPQSAAINQELVKQHFRLAFVQEQYGINSLDSNPTDLKRFEVPRAMTPEQLVAHLAMSDPGVQAKMLEAEFWMRSDQPARAQAIYDELKAEGIAAPRLWAGEGAAVARTGDVFRAQELYARADAMQSEGGGFGDDRYRRLLQQSKNGSGPSVGTEAQGFSDSQANGVSKMLLRGGVPVRAARIQGWVGQGRYSDRGGPDGSRASITGREAGLQMRWFPTRKLSVDSSFARRSFSESVPGAGAKNADNYAVGAAYQIFPQLNIALRDGMGNIETAAAIRQGRRFHSDGGGLVWDPAIDWKVTADYDVWRYDDANVQDNLRLALQRRLRDWLTLGSTYLREDSKRASTQYYTPQGLNQFTGSFMVRQPFGARSARTGFARGDAMLRYEAGYGVQTNNSRMVQSVRGGFSWRFADFLVMTADAQYSMSPTYISRQVTGGLGLSY